MQIVDAGLNTKMVKVYSHLDMIKNLSRLVFGQKNKFVVFESVMLHSSTPMKLLRIAFYTSPRKSSISSSLMTSISSKL